MNEHIRRRKRRRYLIYFGATIAFLAALKFLLNIFPEAEKDLRRGLRNAVEKTFPQQATEVARSFGLSSYGNKSEESPRIDTAESSVVLIHGLDEPGKVWMNLAPALSADNINVFEMRYPNDQPIVDSAWSFYEELKNLPQLGVKRIALVAHSMGGLVSREMLTNPQIAYSEHSRSEQVPEVAGLIMVGTPNHGSELARFRVFAEIRDQWSNLVNGQGHLLRGIYDGAGEAKIDLLPDSRFLQTLNSRPHPEGVSMLVIAGIASPWDDQDIDRFITSARAETSVMDHQLLGDLEGFLKSMADGLGDGLVTVESTRLDGIDHQTVRGTHLSMIRNLTDKSGRTPPAVPVIKTYLGRMFSKH